MSATNVISWLRRLWRREEGESVIGFALIFPSFLLLTMGTLETALIAFDYHRASEATRQGVRAAIIAKPIFTVSDFARGGDVVCAETGGSVKCSGASVSNAAVFNQIVGDMATFDKKITPANVQIEYTDSGLGDPTTPGGIIPLVTVRLVDLQQPFYFLDAFPGVPASYTYPSFRSTQMGSGIGKGT
jgi:hypothetical protein